MEMRSVLMCAPRHYGIEYEINPWMDVDEQPDKHLAWAQWEALVRSYCRLGLEVRLAEPRRGLPDMVFTANGGLVRGGKALLARFRYPERRAEEPHWREWFEGAGIEVVETPEGCSFEGAGEAMFLGDLCVFGWGFRSDAGAAAAIEAAFSCEALPVRLVNPRFYHLDTCFSPLDGETALVYQPAIAPDDFARLRRRVPRLVEVTDEEAAEFACNAIVVGRTVVTSSDSPRLRERLAGLAFELEYRDLSEFRKSGGGARCLTLSLS